MDETAMAVLVFNGQRENVLETLGQWDRDLTRASRRDFAKLLVAGRVDAGGVRVSRTHVDVFKKERGYCDFLETSAKSGLGCEELKQAIVRGIRWEDIPWRSSPLLFKRLKDEIIRLKEAGRVLMRFNEMRETLELRLCGEQLRFTDEELEAVVRLLAGPGIVWELKFGRWVLLQPERINAYAQALIQTVRADEDERGCIDEERVLSGKLTYHRPQERLPADDERFVLLAMHKILVERGLCLREHTETGTKLILPSFYRRERPELVGHPAALMSYRFNGFLDDIYATLVVRLHHTRPFKHDRLWHYAADFKTLTGKQIGVKLEQRAEGVGELVVYSDSAVANAEKVIFSRYVHEHILQKGRDIVRLRHYICPYCGIPVGNREVAMQRLSQWLENQSFAAKSREIYEATEMASKLPTIICSNCEKRVPLWDELEEHFASDEVRERVRQLQAESDFVLDGESKDRALVGEVISTVALAGQIAVEYSAKRHGLDMEIEFRDDDGKPTARKLYLQLKSGNCLRKRTSDGAEVFQVDEQDHAKYWMGLGHPVLLVIANDKGDVRCMELRGDLRRANDLMLERRGILQLDLKFEQDRRQSIEHEQDMQLKRMREGARLTDESSELAIRREREEDIRGLQVLENDLRHRHGVRDDAIEQQLEHARGLHGQRELERQKCLLTERARVRDAIRVLESEIDRERNGYLKRLREMEEELARSDVMQIVFVGEKFDVMCVRNWRTRLLHGDLS